MNKTIGICGYGSSGSSAFVDILREFENVRIMDSIEFRMMWLPDGLRDLEFHIKKYISPINSTVAINRFRRHIKKCFSYYFGKYQYAGYKEKIDRAVESFLNKIIVDSWKRGYGDLALYEKKPLVLWFVRRAARVLRMHKLRQRLDQIILYNYEDTIKTPEIFDDAAKIFVLSIMEIICEKYCDKKEGMITVTDQLFSPFNPVETFGFFENPKAIIVNRDPRDMYLFSKLYLRPRGLIIFPTDNVDDFIKRYRLTRKTQQERNDVMVINFEELVYDCENATKKIMGFLGLTAQIHKGEFFKPAHSRNNTQLFKKYKGYESEIKRIEQELSEYIFPFENYPDIEPEGEMFWGSQHKKRC